MVVVLDSNVLVAAFAARGLCHALFEASVQNCAIATCPQILDEVEKALREKIKLGEETIADLAGFLRETTVFYPEPRPIKPICRDSEDDGILALALEAHAAHIVSGDKDLLDLIEFEGITILSPRAFYEALRKLDA